MKRVFVALYDDVENAQGAVEDLHEAGFGRRDISVIRRNATEDFVDRSEPVELRDEDVDRVGADAILGGLTGMVVGLLALAIPGVGPVIAAGPIAAAIVGAGAGIVTGGLVGALVELGVEEETAGYYAEGVSRGGTLVAVETPVNREAEVNEILEDHDPVDLERRLTNWREEGWERFNPEREPYRL